MFDNTLELCREMQAKSARGSVLMQKIARRHTRRDLLFIGSEMALTWAVFHSALGGCTNSNTALVHGSGQLPGRMTELARH
jgi:hypothetical protein